VGEEEVELDEEYDESARESVKDETAARLVTKGRSSGSTESRRHVVFRCMISVTIGRDQGLLRLLGIAGYSILYSETSRNDSRSFYGPSTPYYDPDLAENRKETWSRAPILFV
jgi:hypothetical protein